MPPCIRFNLTLRSQIYSVSKKSLDKVHELKNMKSLCYERQWDQKILVRTIYINKFSQILQNKIHHRCLLGS